MVETDLLLRGTYFLHIQDGQASLPQMEAECFLETSVNIYILHDITFQKIVIVMVSAMTVPLAP
jgi:hypothetical protein